MSIQNVSNRVLYTHYIALAIDPFLGPYWLPLHALEAQSHDTRLPAHALGAKGQESSAPAEPSSKCRILHHIAEMINSGTLIEN